MTERKTSLKALIMDDPRVVRSMKELRVKLNDKKAIDVAVIRKEIFSTHVTRDVRSLRPESILQSSAHNIVDVSAEEIRTRSRLTEIKMHCIVEIEDINDILGSLTRYILAKFDRPLKAKFKSITDRKSYVQVLLDRYKQRVRELEVLVQLATLVTDDIQEAGWGLKRITDVVIEANNRRERK